MTSKESELPQSTLDKESFKLIRGFRKKLKTYPDYLHGLHTLKTTDKPERPDRSVRFQMGDELVDVIDNFISKDAQLFTIRKRRASLEVLDYDFWEEEVHIIAILNNPNLSSSILYGNIHAQRQFDKNNPSTLSSILKFINQLNEIKNSP